ncbi:MAG: Gfo/Idh/MocA family oxidoreductase [Candidatus Saganbacteria bacterium]|nr:Gfo/Idh/MocA family oxidoreductase [Candidatus Saganbacteria bacterium]
MIKAGVIGTGFMGELHCKAYSAASEADLAGIFDTDNKRAAEIAEKYKTVPFSDPEKFLEAVDIASIAVPTVLHFRYAKMCAEKKVHTLIEKPITATTQEAGELMRLIDASNTISAVGYIERFNPAVTELFKALKGKKVLSIKASRHAPPAGRANDVSVVIDLMLHDLDIVLNIAGSRPVGVASRGGKAGGEVLSSVDADIIFENAVTAELSASKIAPEKSRTIEIKCEDCEINADLIKRNVTVSRNGSIVETTQARGEEPIKAEVNDFIESVILRRKPAVSARDSLNSFYLAAEIEKKCVLS